MKHRDYLENYIIELIVLCFNQKIMSQLFSKLKLKKIVHQTLPGAAIF